ncbi:MAG: ribose transport system ATP-binding protein [Phycisphaerales bacterium]|jgi:ribose transport system ATP-binding protein|nr:ribose transport system ATP-binding protein [Phycisphaerales bacterium]
MMSPPRLEMLGVRKRFGATIALDGVDFAVDPGSVHALVGENGAGKSTLMKILAGALKPDEGQLRLDGESFAPMNPLAGRRAGVAMIYQELSLCPHLSVEENILLGMEPTVAGWLKRGEIRARARDALQQLGHADISPKARAGTLSIAKQQLVEIGRAVAVGCRVLVLDEPTSSLTQADTQRLFQLVATLKNRGHAIVYISHFLEEVKQVADKLTVLRDGRSVGTRDVAGASISEIIGLMVGRQMEDLYPRSPRQPGEAILELDALAGKSKPRNASLQLRRGEVLGIAGLMGAGRTELLRTIFGLDAVRSGRVRVGTFIGNHSPTRRLREGVGMLSEDRKGEGLALNLSIADNMTMSNLAPLGPPGLVAPRRQDAAARKWIAPLAIKCRSPRQPIGQLSGGNQQKVAIARLLHHDVDVLLLDEPTRGIDVGSKAQIYRLIDELACAGKAVLMVSSYLPELLGTCDRVAVMCRGVLGPARDVEQLDAQQIMMEATGN